jgi:hypothetical protein
MRDQTDKASIPGLDEAPDLRLLAADLRQIIGLESAPVAVFMLAPGADMAPFSGWTEVERHR